MSENFVVDVVLARIEAAVRSEREACIMDARAEAMDCGCWERISTRIVARRIIEKDSPQVPAPDGQSSQQGDGSKAVAGRAPGEFERVVASLEGCSFAGDSGVLSDPDMLRHWIAEAQRIAATGSGCGGCPVDVRTDMLLGLSSAADAALELVKAWKLSSPFPRAPGDLCAVCGHRRSQHHSYSDHWECDGEGCECDNYLSSPVPRAPGAVDPNRIVLSSPVPRETEGAVTGALGREAIAGSRGERPASTSVAGLESQPSEDFESRLRAAGIDIARERAPVGAVAGAHDHTTGPLGGDGTICDDPACPLPGQREPESEERQPSEEEDVFRRMCTDLGRGMNFAFDLHEAARWHFEQTAKLRADRDGLWRAHEILRAKNEELRRDLAATDWRMVADLRAKLLALGLGADRVENENRDLRAKLAEAERQRDDVREARDRAERNAMDRAGALDRAVLDGIGWMNRALAAEAERDQWKAHADACARDGRAMRAELAEAELVRDGLRLDLKACALASEQLLDVARGERDQWKAHMEAAIRGLKGKGEKRS